MTVSRGPRNAGQTRGAEYRLKIDAYSPETMPMARLAQYMSEFAALLGERDAVHFHRLTRGSTVLNAKIDREAAPKVRDRIESVRVGEATGEPMRAFATINKLLRDDNAVGILKSTHTKGIVIRFPGREAAEEKFASIRQQGSIDGIVTGVRGRDDTIHITIQSEGRQISGCEASRTIAKQLGAKLFEPVRLFGRGKWSRDADGVWTLLYFKIENFEALRDETLTDALIDLRSIPTEWGDDAYSLLDMIRQGPRSKQNGGH